MIAGGDYIQEQLDRLFWSAFNCGDGVARRMTRQEYSPLIGSNSVDVTLGRTLLLPRGGNQVVDLDMENQNLYERMVLRGDYLLAPGQFVLGSVEQAFECSTSGRLDLASRRFEEDQTVRWVPMYDGRSTTARLGLQSHMTAGFGDYGFDGCFTLEIHNAGPFFLPLRPGMRIGQVYFQQALEPRLYAGAYSRNEHQRGEPVPPKLGPGRF